MSAVREWFVDLIYPKTCASCGERGRWVCDHCLAQLPLFTDTLCERCGVPILQSPCRCADLPAAIDTVRSVGPFAGWLRDSILAFKYEDEWARVDFLGPRLADVVTQLGPVDVIVPVPLHHSRLRERGYNQSALLAKAVARALRVDYADAIARTRATAQQARLDAAARSVNVEGAFAMQPDFNASNRRVVLVDDVLTTGSTLGACAEALVDAGASEVIAVTLARQL